MSRAAAPAAGPWPPGVADILATPRLLEAARADGARVVGYTCSYVPEPLLSVAGLVPVRLRAPVAGGTPLADTYLSSVLCPYPRSLLELALGDELGHLDGWVFAASCDHLRRLWDNLRYLCRPAFAHMLDLPHKTDAAAVDWYADELRELAAALAAHFGVDPGDAALAAAIERHNEYVAHVQAIGELRRRERPPLTGAEYHGLLVAGATAPKAALVPHLGGLRRALEGRDGGPAPRARLMIVGSQLDDPRFTALVEASGALVVADRYCWGSLMSPGPISLAGDPIRALAAHYLGRTSCPRMMDDHPARARDVRAQAAAYRVDGVVLVTMKFCDLWGYEAVALAGALREAGLKVLHLEREYALAGEGQLATRIQAFLESLGR